MNDEQKSEQKGERLEGWKKIAAYLKRDVRTVQRWEQTNGLPIHRQPRAQRPIPFAYTSELDDWWKRGVPAEPPRPSRRLIFIRVGLTLLLMVAVFALMLWVGARSAPGRSVAVLAFVDLSEHMANEEFADGVSEELIDHLNRIPGLRAPAPASTFFYKNKQVPVIGRALSVMYVLDGSVRKTGESVRVAARLIRVRDSAVVWSASYDRRSGKPLALQDEIAGTITQDIQKFVGGK